MLSEPSLHSETFRIRERVCSSQGSLEQRTTHYTSRNCAVMTHALCCVHNASIPTRSKSTFAPRTCCSCHGRFSRRVRRCWPSTSVCRSLHRAHITSPSLLEAALALICTT